MSDNKSELQDVLNQLFVIYSSLDRKKFYKKLFGLAYMMIFFYSELTPKWSQIRMQSNVRS